MKKLELIKFYNTKSNKDMGEYIPSGQNQNKVISELKETIKKEVMTQSKGVKVFKSTYESFNIIWKTNKDSIAIIIVTKSDISSDSIDMLLDEIDNQNLVKYVDSKGFINNVAKQNLQFMIEKYFSENKSNSSFYSDISAGEVTTASVNRISQVKDEINSVATDMKNNIKNMVMNVENAQVLEDRSIHIKDTSLIFRNQSENLAKVAKCRRYRNLAIIGGGIVLAGLVIYLILS